MDLEEFKKDRDEALASGNPNKMRAYCIDKFNSVYEQNATLKTKQKVYLSSFRTKKISFCDKSEFAGTIERWFEGSHACAAAFAAQTSSPRTPLYKNYRLPYGRR